MQRFVYFIFIMPFTQSFAMETLGAGSIAPGNKVIMVANTTKQGIVVQVSEPARVEEKRDDKIWLGTIRRGCIEVSPPQPPRLMHALVVKDTNETVTLASADFEHPQDNSTLFQVFTADGVVKVEQREDPTNPSSCDQDNESGDLVTFVQSRTSDPSLVGALVIASQIAKK